MARKEPSKAGMTSAEYSAWVVSRSRPLSARKSEKIAALLRPVSGGSAE